jgi:hypothetical protein
MGMEIGSFFLPAPPSAAERAFPGSDLRFNGREEGEGDSRRGKRGAGPKGSDVTKFGEGMSAILSISKRFKIFKGFKRS